MSAVVLDSSVWIELLTSGPRAASCTQALEKATQVHVPTLILYEVYKKVALSTSEDQALSAVALLSQHPVRDLTREVALAAADLSIQRKLPMADSLVLAHAQHVGATLVTLNNDFAGIPGAQVLRT